MKNNDSLSILAIDDDEAVLKSIELCVRTFGCKLTTTHNAKEGMELARTLQPDVILCDGIMSGLSGEQTIEMLKSDPATAAIPVILMTGQSVRSFPDVHWTGFLAKPFGPEELRAAVESVVSGRTPPKTEQ